MKYSILNNSKNLLIRNQNGLYLNILKNKYFSTSISNKITNPFHFQNDNQETVKSLDSVIDKVLIREKLEKGAVDQSKENVDQEVIKEEVSENEVTESIIDFEQIEKIQETKEQTTKSSKVKEGEEEVDFWFEEKVEEEFIPMWQRISKDSSMKEAFQPGKLTPELLTTYLTNQRALDIKVINMKKKCDWADFIVICSVNSSRQLQNLAEKLRKFIKQCQPHDSSIPQKFEIEGDIKDEWLVIDLNTILIHIFLPKTRSEYDIEGIWESIQNNPTSPNTSSNISGNFTIEDPNSNDNEVEVELKDRNIQKMLGELRDQFINENRVQLEKKVEVEVEEKEKSEDDKETK